MCYKSVWRIRNNSLQIRKEHFANSDSDSDLYET